MQYTLHKGTGDAFHSTMQDMSVPLHRRHGIDVVSFGHSLHDTDSYYLSRAFASEESMVSILETFYTSPDWRSEPREDIINCIETNIKIVICLPSVSVDGLRM